MNIVLFSVFLSFVILAGKFLKSCWQHCLSPHKYAKAEFHHLKIHHKYQQSRAEQNPRRVLDVFISHTVKTVTPRTARSKDV